VESNPLGPQANEKIAMIKGKVNAARLLIMLLMKFSN
jgi:hypothetical protein